MFSTGVGTSGTPTLPPPGHVTGLVAAPGDTQVSLSWTNPAGPIDAVRVVRKQGAAPADPSDGVLVYSGTGTTATDTGLTNDTAYEYGVWVERQGELSTPTGARAVPTSVLTYATQPAGDFANAVSNFNIGFVFHVTVSRAILGFGRAYKAGSTATNQIGIWEDGTGSLLASATVGPSNPAANLPVPLVLTAGKRYVVGVRETSASPWSSGRVATGLPSFLVLDDSAYNRNATFTYPNLRDSQTAPSSSPMTSRSRSALPTASLSSLPIRSPALRPPREISASTSRGRTRPRHSTASASSGKPAQQRRSTQPTGRRCTAAAEPRSPTSGSRTARSTPTPCGWSAAACARPR